MLSFVDELKTRIMSLLKCTESDLSDLVKQIDGLTIYARKPSPFSSLSSIVNDRRRIIKPLKPSTNASSYLQFDSRMESGNLKYAIFKDDVYHLIMDNDAFTKGHTQWFYFSAVNSLPKRRTCHFKIVNFAKNKSLYEIGMGVWTKSGENSKWRCDRAMDIKYGKTEYSSTEHYSYFGVSFSVDMQPGEVLYFGYCVPYTYTRLQDFLATVTSKAPFVERSVIGKSLGGLDIEKITITERPKSAEAASSETPPIAKKDIVVTARVHPGESNASFMLEGLVNFLISDLPEAKILRENYIFQIVPMMNPDGVVLGNYRCSLAGVDLNRRWRKPSMEFHPEILAVRDILTGCEHKRDTIYIDLHGHSKHRGFFCYGSGFEFIQDFAHQMKKIDPRNFALKNCRFTISKGKRGTARAVGYLDIKIGKCYTVESSFAEFTIDEYRSVGRTICKAILSQRADLLEQLRKVKEEVGPQGAERSSVISEEVEGEDDEGGSGVMKTKRCIDDEISSDGGDASDGSESNPSEDNFSEPEETIKKVFLSIPKKVAAKKKEKKKKGKKSSISSLPTPKVTVGSGSSSKRASNDSSSENTKAKLTEILANVLPPKSSSNLNQTESSSDTAAKGSAAPHAMVTLSDVINRAKFLSRVVSQIKKQRAKTVDTEYRVKNPYKITEIQFGGEEPAFFQKEPFQF
jgi:cytosolic carboxypeptidase protein 2/3